MMKTLRRKACGTGSIKNAVTEDDDSHARSILNRIPQQELSLYYDRFSDYSRTHMTRIRGDLARYIVIVQRVWHVSPALRCG